MSANREENLAKQLTWNQTTWRALQALGASSESQLDIDFFYDAPDHGSATALSAFLDSNADYRSGVFERDSEWAVEGSVPMTNVSLALLDAWVTQMIDAGERFECQFDGWGAVPPSAKL